MNKYSSVHRGLRVSLSKGHIRYYGQVRGPHV